MSPGLMLLIFDALIFGISVWRLCRTRDQSGAIWAIAILSGLPLVLTLGSIAFVTTFGVLR